MGGTGAPHGMAGEAAFRGQNDQAKELAEGKPMALNGRDEFAGETQLLVSAAATHPSPHFSCAGDCHGSGWIATDGGMAGVAVCGPGN